MISDSTLYVEAIFKELERLNNLKLLDQFTGEFQRNGQEKELEESKLVDTLRSWLNSIPGLLKPKDKSVSDSDHDVSICNVVTGDDEVTDDEVESDLASKESLSKAEAVVKSEAIEKIFNHISFGDEREKSQVALKSPKTDRFSFVCGNGPYYKVTFIKSSNTDKEPIMNSSGFEWVNSILNVQRIPIHQSTVYCYVGDGSYKLIIEPIDQKLIS